MRLADAVWALGAMAIATAVMAWVMKLWNADLYVPFAPVDGDAALVLSAVQGMLRHGWVVTNPDLGAPAGQQLYDYPSFAADTLHLALMWPLRLFTSNPAPVVNAYFVAGFPLAALSGFALMRWMRVSRPVAMVCAALFALAPYHFLRSEWHLFMGAYFLVPLAAYLILAVYAEEPLFVRRETGPRALRWASRRTLLTVAACMLVGASDQYYAAFTALLLAAAGALTFVGRRSRRALATSAVLIALLGITFTAQLTPTLVYRAEHGVNHVVAQREPEESFAFSTNLTDLLFPVGNHRLAPLDRLGKHYSGSVPVGHETADRLGIVAALGLVWLLVVALALLVGGAPGRPGRDPRHRHLSAAAISALLIGTTGGVSGVIAYTITPQLRAWNRISIFIALFALLAIALLLDALRERLRRPTLLAAVLGAVLAIGVLDQTNSSFAPDHDALAAQWRSDGVFVSAIEKRLPRGAMVLQLPYVPFPENPPVERLQAYPHLRAYFHSHDLRWSVGAIKGRPDDFLAPLAGKPLATIVARARAAGFRGIYVDRFGYADNAASVETELTRLLRERPMQSPDGRLLFFAFRT